MDSENDIIFPKPSERDTASKTVDSSNEASQGEPVMYSCAKTSADADLSKATTAPTEPESTEGEKEKEEEKIEEEDVDEEEEEVDDFPKFEAGEARGRVVQPIAGTKTTRPVRPN